MGTILARTGLTKPARGDLNWDDEVQGWLDKLDTYGAFADETLTWTATQTFTAAAAQLLQVHTVQAVTLTADDTEITPTSTLITLTSDNATATNRTFSFPRPSAAGLPQSGQFLLLIWLDDTYKGEIVGDVKTSLSAAWPSATPRWDTLLLCSILDVWVEVARSSNGDT